MIDFERAQLRTSNDEAARRFMLAKIDRELAGAPVGDRMRFLCAYCDGDRAEARRWWRRVEDFAPRLAHRDFGRMTRNATRAGRRFRRLAYGAWRGYAQIGVDDAPLLEALPEARPSGAAVRVEAMDEFWRVHYGGLRQSEGRRIWVTANFLWARGGLCPRPLGAWSRGDQTVLLLERRAGAQATGPVPRPDPGPGRRPHPSGPHPALAEIREPPLPGDPLDRGSARARRFAPPWRRPTGYA